MKLMWLMSLSCLLVFGASDLRADQRLSGPIIRCDDVGQTPLIADFSGAELTVSTTGEVTGLSGSLNVNSAESIPLPSLSPFLIGSLGRGTSVIVFESHAFGGQDAFVALRLEGNGQSFSRAKGSVSASFPNLLDSESWSTCSLSTQGSWAAGLSCTSNCTCKGPDGSSAIPLKSSGATQNEALQSAQGQCDYFARLSGAAAGACQVTDFSCR